MLAPVTSYLAEQIGKLYSEARTSHLLSVTLLLNVGSHLTAIKRDIPHGDWLLWLKDHKDILGFGDRTARRLIEAARKWTSTSNLTDEGAAEVSRLIWGNETPSGEPSDDHSRDYKKLWAFLRWTSVSKPVDVLCSLSPAELSELLPELSALRGWLNQFESNLAGKTRAA